MAKTRAKEILKRECWNCFYSHGFQSGADLDLEQLSLEMSGQPLHAAPVPAAQLQATPQAVNQHATPHFAHQAGNVMYTHQFMPQHPQMQMAMHPQQQQSVPQTQGFPMYATPTFQAVPQTAPQGKAAQDQQHLIIFH